MIGTLIAIFLTAAAVVFASHETKLLGFSTEEVEMQQSARSAMDLLARDVEMAGAGIGYRLNPGTNPEFVGLQTGTFRALDDGLQFNTSGPSTPVTGLREQASSPVAYNFATHDLGILFADGERMTIVNAPSGAAGSGFICDAGNLLDPARTYLVTFRTGDLITGITKTMQVSGNAGPGNCPAGFGLCEPAPGNGCRAMNFATDNFGPGNAPLYQSADDGTVGYAQGEVSVGVKQVIWWVARDTAAMDAHRANLRRVEIDSAASTCALGTRQTCGGEVAYNVETLQYQVWRYLPGGAVGADPTGVNNDGRWALVGPGAIISPAGAVPRPKLRVDIELVLRSRVPDETPHAGARVTLAGAAGLCLPGGTAMPAGAPCPGDRVQRRVHRITVDVKNSSR